MDIDGDRFWLLIALLVVCVLLRAWFSACEAALTEVNDAKVHSLAETDPAWRKLAKIILEPSRLLTSFTAHRILSALWLGTLTLGIFGKPLASLFPIRDGVLLAGLLLTLVAAWVLTVFTDLLPKWLVRRDPDQFARFAVGSVRILCFCLAPFVWLTSGALKLLCKVFGISATPNAEVVTEEEIRMLVDAGNETGGIEESQREMINNIFAFDDVTVSEVMTHRKDISAVPKDAIALDVAKLACEEGFSRIPVYDGTVDTIVGVILVKDLLRYVGEAGDSSIFPVMREVTFVPESAKCRDVFQQMRREKSQMAIISDEYGGTAGVVTMEDLLEEIVGSIQDEYDDEEAELTEVVEGVFSIDGAADPEDILPALGVKPELAKDFDTMSAFVVHLLGCIPASGEKRSVEHEGICYTPVEFEDNWVSRIEARRLPKREKMDTQEK